MTAPLSSSKPSVKLDEAALAAALNCKPYPKLDMTAAQLLAQGSLTPAFLASAIGAYAGALAPLSEPGGEEPVASELVKTLAEAEKLVASWSGSAFVAGETSKTDADTKSALYSDLCGLLNTLAWCSDEVATLTASLTQAQARIVEATKVIEGLEALFPRPGENSVERFERLADAFYRATGLMRPGKDDARALESREERETAYDNWYSAFAERARTFLSNPSGAK